MSGDAAATGERRPVYGRILLKLSGEAMMGNKGYGIDPDVTRAIAEEIRDVRALGVQIAIVIGGGNIFRGVAAAGSGMDRIAGDHMGMLATVINGIAMQDSLEKLGVFTRLMTAIEMREVAEPYIRRRAVRHVEKGRVVILAGGTGNPYFTTDTAAALRAMEIKADAILKATRVDGIYTADPKLHADAVKIEHISHIDVLKRGLKVMDATAISLCMDNKLPIRVFDLRQKGNILKIVLGDPIGSAVG